MPVMRAIPSGSWLASVAEEGFPLWSLPGFLLLAALVGFVSMWILYRRARERAAFALAQMSASEKRQVDALHAAQRLARETEQSFRALFDDAVVGMCRTHRDGHILSANDALSQMLGYTSPEDLLHSVKNVGSQLYVHPEQRDAVVRRLTSEGGAATRELEFYRKDGSTMWILAHTREVRDAHGDHLYFIGTVQDVNVRHLLEQKVRQAQKMEAIGRLTGGVAHDFNNLLTAILGYAHFAAHKLGPAHPQHTYIDQIRKAAERAEKLTRQLLNFCRQEPLDRQTFDLNLVVKETGYLLRRLIGEDINLHMVLNPEGVVITADTGEVGQVLMNLALNARDAMPRGGDIAIETTFAFYHSEEECPAELIPGRYARLTVRDTGSGIDPSVLPHIFEPFYTTKPRGSGTGLGLSTSRDIVRQTGGTIIVESIPGKGTAFIVYLPLSEVAETSLELETPAAVPPVSGAGAAETVLIVEDEEILRRLITDILEAYGYRLLSAANGEDALRICDGFAGPIGLVVTDVVMPRMNGCELVGRLLERHPEMQVLYISGHGEHAVLEQAANASDGFALLSKPFRADELARAVREALDRSLLHVAA